MKERQMWKLLIEVVSPLLLFAQVERWVYRYDGPEHSWDWASSVVYGLDGNIYTAGMSTGTGTFWDFTVISLTNTGAERWVYRYNGTENSWDWANGIVYGLDGNLYIAGLSTGSGTAYDFMVISLDTSGTERWVYTYNGSENGDDEAYSIVYGSDGNLYVAGYSEGSGTSFDFTIISLTNTGTERWVYTYNGPGSDWDWANTIVYGVDGNLYIAGYTNVSDPFWDFTVISLTNAGDERWVYSYNGSANDEDGANSIVYGADENLYAAGYSIESATFHDFTIVSLTNAGIERWIYQYNGPANDWEEAFSIVYGSDGNLYAAGYSVGSGTSDDFVIISVTNAGTERWIYRYNGPGNNADGASSVVYGLDGTIYTAGMSTGSGTIDDFVVISVANTGIERWVYRYNGPGNSSDQANAIIYGADGNLYTTGRSTGSGTGADFTIISLTTVGAVEEQRESSSLKVVPVSTFFQDGIKLRFKESSQKPLKVVLYSVCGTKVLEKIYPFIPVSLTIQDVRLTEISSGIYFLFVASGEKELGKIKLIKLSYR